jgi:transketolase
MFAAHHGLDNLIAMTDWNGQQIDGPVEKVAGEGNLEAKWKAFGWNVIVAEGNEFTSILNAFAQAKANKSGKPTMILFKTNMGQGVDFMVGTNKWHGKAPSQEQCDQAMAQLEETLGDY